VTTDLELFVVHQDDVEIHAEAIRLKEQALVGGALIGTVTDEASNAACVEAMKEIKRVLSLAEETRQRIKRPVLDLSRMIDCRAKDYCLELQEELHRLGRACADFQTAQLERVKAQERARQAELARIEREKQEALREIEEEERRKAEEARRKAAAEAAAAKSEADRQAAFERAKAEAARLAAEAEARAKAEEERRAQEQMSLGPAPVPVRADGQISKPVWSWEVTDIWTLARMQPGLVEITPRRQQINDVITSMSAAGEPKIPGLRIWQEMKVGVRVGRQKEAIDV
jgi:chemotaxis protein histidine kinase CheA